MGYLSNAPEATWHVALLIELPLSLGKLDCVRLLLLSVLLGGHSHQVCGGDHSGSVQVLLDLLPLAGENR